MTIEPTSGYLHQGVFYATKNEAVRAAIAGIAKSLMRDHSDDLAAGLVAKASTLGPLLTSLVKESIPNDAAVSSEPEGPYSRPTTGEIKYAIQRLAEHGYTAHRAPGTSEYFVHYRYWNNVPVLTPGALVKLAVGVESGQVKPADESIPNDMVVSSEPEGTYPTTRQFPASQKPQLDVCSGQADKTDLLTRAIEHLEKRAGYTIAADRVQGGYRVYRDTKHYPVFTEHMDEEQIVCLAKIHKWEPE